MTEPLRAIDPALFDPDTAASDDFYRHVNGGWLDANPVPPEYGVVGRVARGQRAQPGAAAPAAARTPRPGPTRRGSAGQMVGDYFAAAMDEEAIAAAGVQPLAAVPRAHRRPPSPSPTCATSCATCSASASSPLHSLGIAPDFEDADAYLVYVGQGGLGLPERDYYTRDDERSATLREQYVAHVAAQLGNLGDAERRGARGRRARSSPSRPASPRRPTPPSSCATCSSR